MRYCLAALAALFAIGVLFSSNCPAIDHGSIVGIWLFDEGSGDEINDTSGNGNDGIVVGATWTDGVFGSALEFDGTNHAEVPASNGIDDIMDGFTYMIWAMPTAPPLDANNTRLMERDWHNPTIQIGAADFYGSIAVGADQANTHVRGGAWEQGEWSFVALTYDGDVIKLYVDGEMVGEKAVGKPDEDSHSATPEDQQGAIWFAQWKAGAGWSFTGALDEAAVFNVPLSEEDIQDIMNNGLEKIAAVSSLGKLSVTWGYVKNVR